MAELGQPDESPAQRRKRWIAEQNAALRRPRTAWRRLRGGVGHAGAWALAALWLVGGAVRLTVQDSGPLPLAFLYYATPPSVLAGLAGVAGAWWLILRRRALAWPAFAAALACLIWTYRVAWVHNPPRTPPPEAVRVLFWNVARGALGRAQLVAAVRAYDADVIQLAEAGEDNAATRETWQTPFPEYQLATLDDEIVLLVRGGLSVRSSGYLGADSQMAFGWYNVCDLIVRNQHLVLVAIDVHATFLRPRSAPLNILSRVVDEFGDVPILVLGDFNTPSDSVHLRPLRRTMVNAFETAGNGYTGTWPLPIPLIAIDQAWVNDHLRVERCALGWSPLSDHRPLTLDVSVRH